ncbi:MAG: BlaI/MecI/CopY family transcriptional regulator [Lachnospiraceae bacterium]|nr:BlaI/MecI/CopY family transcriptional regulator [Lachnospiraceae bacterium]
MNTDDKELTKAEVMVMQTIWAADEEMMMGEILKRVNQKQPKTWKPQMLTSYLQRLVKKGFLLMKRQGRSYVYEVLIPEDDFRQTEMARFADTWGHQSPAGFVAAFNRDHLLTKEQKDELRNLINGFD